MLACDFCHVDCAVTLERLCCLFATEVGSRYVHILGVTASPDGPQATQQIRNLGRSRATRVCCQVSRSFGTGTYTSLG
jgi:putative transposase